MSVFQVGRPYSGNDHNRAGDVTLDWVKALQREALSDKSEWQAICTMHSVHQDGGGYVQDHAHHDSSLLSRGNPSNGGD